MKTISKPTKKNTILLIIIAAFIVALIAVIIAIFAPKPQDTVSGIPTVAVETPYCILKYPEQWKDQMAVEQSEASGCLSETFYAVIADSRYKLFTVYFGNSLTGELFGYLPSDGDMIPVYIECHSVTEGIGLSESELALFYAMMDGVNEVTRSISAVPGYSAP